MKASIAGWRARGRTRRPRRCCVIPRMHDRHTQPGVGSRLDMGSKKRRSRAAGAVILHTPKVRLAQAHPRKLSPQHLHRRRRRVALHCIASTTTSQPYLHTHIRINLLSLHNTHKTNHNVNNNNPHPLPLPPPPARTPRQRPDHAHRAPKALRRLPPPNPPAHPTLHPTVGPRDRGQPGSSGGAVCPVRAGAAHVRDAD